MSRITTPFVALASFLMLGTCYLGTVRADHHEGIEAREAREGLEAEEDGWVALFDGESLDGWRANENKSFQVEDGVIVVGGGGRSHLFYDGDVEDHDFKNFELKAEVLTKPGSNSGIYFHTEYQEEGWPDTGYEAQVNNSFTADPRVTPSLYGVTDVEESPVGDDEWFEYHITVHDKTITLAINGETVVEYTETEKPEHLRNFPGRLLSHGTIALQGHDPGSVVHFRNIRIKPEAE
jgi:hypothetical protein